MGDILGDFLTNSSGRLVVDLKLHLDAFFSFADVAVFLKGALACMAYTLFKMAFFWLLSYDLFLAFILRPFRLPKRSLGRGCQNFLGTTYQNWKNTPNFHEIYQMATKYIKWPQSISNGHKVYQMATKYIKWPQSISNGCKIYQLVIQYTTISHFKALQNLPKLEFLV
jgi:hypothetical protein